MPIVRRAGASQATKNRVRLDVPDEVVNKVVADGNAAWIDELPSVVESLAEDWSLRIGATLRGGHAAFIVEASLADGIADVLKIGVPGIRRELGFEAATLRLAQGDGCPLAARRPRSRTPCSSDSGRPCTTSCPIP